MIQTIRRLSNAQHHREAMQLATEIGATLRRMYRAHTAMVTPDEVIGLLRQAKVTFVLMGAYAINGYRDESRATQDVDVLVRYKDLAKAIEVLHGHYPGLRVVDLPKVTRFIDPLNEKAVIDVIKPLEDMMKAVFRNTVAIGRTHKIPDLEMALVTKFAAMISDTRRRDKKHLDAGDFINIVQTNETKIDIKKLKRLAEKVYHGGGKEIEKFLEDIKADRPISI